MAAAATTAVGQEQQSPQQQTDLEMALPLAPEEVMKSLVEQSSVIIFSKTFCPFCKKAKGALARAGADFTAVELDKREDGDGLQAALTEFTGVKTVPQVFIGGKFIGGGDDTEALQASGELLKMVNAVQPQAAASSPSGDKKKVAWPSDSLRQTSDCSVCAKPGVFFFEMKHRENENVVRARAGMLLIIATVAVTLLLTSLSQELADESMKQKWQSLPNRLPFVVAFVMLDFLLATFLGMGACPLGLAGTVLSLYILKQEPVWKPAAPKRFAWFLGLLMTITCLTIVIVVKSSTRKYALASLASMCVMLTFLETACGFCAGCWMFAMYLNFRAKITGEAPKKCGG